MILITGATGFLGAEVAWQLATAGNTIRCTKRKHSVIPALLAPYKEQIEWVNADITDIFALEDALEGVTEVYHSAAWVSLKQSDKNQMIFTNVTGTANIVNLCLQHNIRLVHVSSIAAIGFAPPGELITENNHLDATTEKDGYALSKLESEMEVWRGVAEGLSAVIINPSLIIGADAGTKGTGQFFETVRKGLLFYPIGSLGWVNVKDVASCMITLMKTAINGERYIISAENRSYKDIADIAANCFNIKPPSIKALPWMMEFAWLSTALLALFTRKPPMIDKAAAQTASLTRNLDNSKIKKTTGIEFKPIDETVREVCERLNG
jgi:dihydroflavonol-4-reductase